MIITTGSMLSPDGEEQKASWEEIKQSSDRQTWIGRACTDRLPGGGNDPHEHSKENNG